MNAWKSEHLVIRGIASRFLSPLAPWFIVSDDLHLSDALRSSRVLCMQQLFE